MAELWKCPHCGARNIKSIRQGPVVDYLPGNLVTYHQSHPDDCPQCHGKVSGAAILAGQYDPFDWTGMIQPLVGLGFMIWFFGAFWLFPFTFKQNLTIGIISVIVWLSPLILLFRSR
jgi:hypothetical protein